MPCTRAHPWVRSGPVLEKIISGGQTGADRAALDAALDLGFPVGGFCPAGRQAEDGVIDSKYPLQELEGGYRERTRKNVLSSDATVIFHDSAIHGGTRETLEFCIEFEKPHQLLDSSRVADDEAIQALSRFITLNEIRVLNVAGPRASDSPNIYHYVRSVLGAVCFRKQL